MYLKLKKSKREKTKGIKMLTVIPIAVALLSVTGISASVGKVQSLVPEETSISTVTTTTEETTEEVTTEVTTEFIEETIAEPEEVIVLDPVLSYNTSVKSNLTEEQYNQILAGTPLAGCGHAFKDIEDTYGVNGIFALSVALNETSYGAAGVGSSRNNVFSNTQASGGYIYFDNKIDSIYYFGAYIPRVHWNNGRYTVSAIAPVYCDYSWGNKVESSMNDIYNRIN